MGGNCAEKVGLVDDEGESSRRILPLRLNNLENNDVCFPMISFKHIRIVSTSRLSVFCTQRFQIDINIRKWKFPEYLIRNPLKVDDLPQKGSYTWWKSTPSFFVFFFLPKLSIIFHFSIFFSSMKSYFVNFNFHVSVSAPIQLTISICIHVQQFRIFDIRLL